MDPGYDASQPLDSAVVSTRRTGGAVLTEVSFAGPRDREIATLVTPAGESNGAGVILAHGGSDDGRHFFEDPAVELARRGYTVALPATRLPPHGDWASSERAILRSITVHRRALDLLTNHADARPDRLGFYGHSAGAFQGAALVGVDFRLRAAVLAAFGSGTLRRIAIRELGQAGRLPADDYLAALDPYDPGRFLGRPRAAAVLLQFGRDDDVVHRDEAEALAAAAGPAATIRWYDSDHGVDASPDARRDRADFFNRHLLRSALLGPAEQ